MINSNRLLYIKGMRPSQRSGPAMCHTHLEHDVRFSQAEDLQSAAEAQTQRGLHSADGASVEAEAETFNTTEPAPQDQSSFYTDEISIDSPQASGSIGDNAENSDHKLPADHKSEVNPKMQRPDL